MTIDEACAMTLDQLCDGGPYPNASDVRAGVATGAPGVTGTLSVTTVTGQILKLSSQGTSQ
jgi:hypothetical protein